MRRLFNVLLLVCLCACGASSRVHVSPSARLQGKGARLQGNRATMRPSDVGNYAATERWFAVARMNDVAARIKFAEAVRRKPVATTTAVAHARYMPPAPVSAPSSSDCQGLLRRYFGDVYGWALHIVQRESNCTPGAVNYREGCDTSGRTQSHAEGYWQICWPQHAALAAEAGCSNPLDGDCNMRMARVLYDEAGRGPWGG